MELSKHLLMLLKLLNETCLQGKLLLLGFNLLDVAISSIIEAVDGLAEVHRFIRHLFQWLAGFEKMDGSSSWLLAYDLGVLQDVAESGVDDDLVAGKAHSSLGLGSEGESEMLKLIWDQVVCQLKKE